MTEQTAEGALEGASPEAVSAEQAASEATENTTGLTETGEPAEAALEAEKAKAEAEETERKSRNERRREARERLIREAQEAQQRADAAERQAKAMKDAIAARPMPKLEDFGGNYEAYTAELAARRTLGIIRDEQAEALAQQARAETDRIKALRAQEQAVINEHVNASVDEAKARYPDFEPLVRAALLGGDLINAVSRTDAPGEVAYWLGKNPGAVAEMNALAASPHPQARDELNRRLGRIEAHIAAPPPPPVTSAPAPIAPVRGKAAPVTGYRDGMSYAEFKAWRASQR